ncbi:MAG: hypothetical protein H7122_08130 [Chitinophagaceae bacterium]|nr:hypothetical protein [Chitinophagaceae bacterium]
MKKIARRVLMMEFLVAWALVAIRSGQSGSHICKAEWNIALMNNEKIVSANHIREKQLDILSDIDVHYPGFMNLVFQ